ncbi:MAG TPA: hypothetical protein VG652_10680 [Gaiellaceae bacterium]|nr:hypothetical protein [Gaiellaceae bacterium]
MIEGDPIGDLQTFIDEGWAVVQPRLYPDVPEGPRVSSELTSAEAAYFLASVGVGGTQPPLFRIDAEGRKRSDRMPPTAKGAPRGYHFFDEIDNNHLRLETIVEMAAMARLQLEFGWPREHLICESPIVTRHGADALHQDALDVLLLEVGRTELAWKMPITAVRPRVGVEAKADAKLLGKLFDGMRACQASGAPHPVTSDHKKCLAIAELQPRLFLGVAAGDTWRLFTVVERDGRAVLGDELPDLNDLHFSPKAKPA